MKLKLPIAIGSANFGRKYGLFGKLGGSIQANEEKIIETARAYEINTIDTAPSYGNAEKILGKIGVNQFQIVTKINPLPNGIKSGEVFDWVSTQVSASLDRLKLVSLYGLLLHHPSDIFGCHQSEYCDAILYLKNEKRIQKFGYSIYCPTELDKLCSILWPDIVQTPLNIIDRRIVQSTWSNLLIAHGTEIHARSIFLQGILLNLDRNLPPYFKRWETLFARWKNHLKISGLRPIEYAIAATKQDAIVSKWIFGVESSGQLEEIMTAFAQNLKIPVEDFTCRDLDLIEPRRWKTM